MDAETKSRIFEPFFTTKEVGEGTGLGLAMVYGIVKQHQGHISVYSEPGKGTTFRLYWPGAQDAVEQKPEAPSVEGGRNGNETVLVVEDEDIVRELTCEILETLGYYVLSAADPIEAMRVSDRYEGPIHLLLTDVVMPQMNGVALYSELAPSREEMKVLFMSGYTESAIVRRGVLNEEVNFLSKPFTLDRLGRKVRQTLDQIKNQN
jgi:CheY-like chemotaxis protein